MRLQIKAERETLPKEYFKGGEYDKKKLKSVWQEK